MKITKRQLRRLIREEKRKIIQENINIVFDEITEDIEAMGYAFADRDTAEMWVDANARYYRGVYVDTRPYQDGSGETKVKIIWPDRRYAGLG